MVESDYSTSASEGNRAKRNEPQAIPFIEINGDDEFQVSIEAMSFLQT